MKQKTLLYTSKTKVCDIILKEPATLEVLKRLNIKLGFGDSNVENLCKKYSVSATLFLMICNIYTYNDYIPNIELLDEKDLDKVIEYLHSSHYYYTTYSFPILHQTIHNMMKEYEKRDCLIFDKFYDDYDAEVSNHFNYEETVVFPYIKSILNKETKEDKEKFYNIRTFEENHSNIEEKLTDLKNIVIKYIPENCSNKYRFDIIHLIFEIEKYGGKNKAYLIRKMKKIKYMFD